MSKRAQWYKMALSARDEALNAVEFYNRPEGRRPLESFLVHMHIAWTYLLLAEFMRDGIQPYYKDPRYKNRYLSVDGDRKAWDLARCASERWASPDHPVRRNIELTAKLRNKIEHRYEHGLMVSAQGFVQALVINFENEITSALGSELSIAEVVHIPVALATFSREGVAQLVAAQEALPKRLRDFFVQYRSGLTPAVREDSRFEFRIEIIQKRAPRSEADLAVSFVNEDELSPDELAAYRELERTGRVILREKARPVANYGNLKPKQACIEIERQIPFRFRPSAEFPQAWKHYKVRPPSSAKGKARRKVDERYCVYDEAFDAYVYKPAFVERLIKECSTEDGFRRVIGRPPTLKGPESQ